MGKEVVLFASEEPHSLKDVAAFLRELADKLDGNEVVLRKGSEELAVQIPNNVVLELKVEEEEKKQRTQRSLEIE
ncbi:MAG: amphi-Trp domain-containing protein, partial [Anaerolineae bacterium]|nr:amphi-Trp domain-containing protein [Anaerolineae bacterium]